MIASRSSNWCACAPVTAFEPSGEIASAVISPLCPLKDLDRRKSNKRPPCAMSGNQNARPLRTHSVVISCFQSSTWQLLTARVRKIAQSLVVQLVRIGGAFVFLAARLCEIADGLGYAMLDAIGFGFSRFRRPCLVLACTPQIEDFRYARSVRA